jgi:hypothetical protein
MELILERQLLARMLYSNPVCILAVGGDSDSSCRHPPAMMTISWLTATDNIGGFFFSISQRRCVRDVCARAFSHGYWV